MLKFNPEERLSATDCLRHIWFIEKQKKIDVDLSERFFEKMKKFKVDRKMQHAVLIYIVNHLLSKKEKNDVLLLFQSFDKNGDGVLCKEEIFERYKNALGEEGAHEKDNEIMKAVDIDDSGTIDYHEFLISATNRQDIINQNKIEQTFRMFDKDGNGSISLDELRSIFSGSAFDEKLFKSILKECDSNEDGEISMNEFVEMMSLNLN